MSIATLLEAAAEERPAAVFLRAAEGDLTYAQTWQRSTRIAYGLDQAGARPGEPVVLLMHNNLDQLVTWFALARLAAVHVPLNTELVHASLAHAFRITGAALAVVDADLLPSVLAVIDELPELRRLIVRGKIDHPIPSGIEVSQFDALAQDGAPGRTPPTTGDELDTATVLFTSGTTGVAKGCMLSHRYLVRQGELHASNLRLTADDVLYAPFPLFHVDAATLTVVAALTVGATAAIGRRFSASGFWDEARAFQATVFNFLGATLTILWKRPPGPSDRDHRVRLAWGVPMPTWKSEWEKRFGFPLYELYGLTDGGISAYDPLDEPKRAGSCGRVLPEFELRIVDGSNQPVPAGTVGEITVRGREPGLVMNGYWGMPDATEQAFRGGYLHTGDLGRLDADGYLYFLGRGPDVIRRRGENISAQDIEQLVTSHPDVVEAAAIGVASELTEQDVKVCVVVRPGSALAPADVRRYCLEHGPAFMAPRYVELLTELPKTPTQKVEKFRLETDPHAPGTWDADAIG